MNRPKLGLALGAGGARGWCHIGVIRALEERGLKPDVIAGASMGAAVGAAYAGGKLDALEEWAVTLTRARYLRLLDIRLNSGGLIGGGELREVLARIGVPERFEDLTIPLTVVACEMRTGAERWFQSGVLADAVRGSAAVPGVLSPHAVEGDWMLDGGLVNPVPVSACRAMGADVVIAVDPNAKRGGAVWTERDRQDWSELFPKAQDWFPALPDILRQEERGPAQPSYAEVVSTAIEIMIDRILRARLAGDPPDLLMNADLAADMTIMEFDRAAEAIEDGKRMVRVNAAALDDIESRLS